jgi:cytochrome P450
MKKWGRSPPGQKTYSIINAPDDIHARQRRMLSHAFSDRAVSNLIRQDNVVEILILLDS